ncbi:MAG: alpha/beta hydrolase, partial [Acidocella sp.]|nr:alpha/beta hydrolase [Acidocella sp.]
QNLSKATGCGVLVYSRFGYGQSAPAPLPFPLTYMHDHAHDILPRILDETGVKRAILLGHSDGASIATIYAGGRQDFRLRGIILIAPHFFVEDITIASIKAAKTAYEQTDLRVRLAKYHADVDNAFWGWNGAWLDPRFALWRIDDHLATIRVPILIIQGEADEYGTAAQIECARSEVYCPFEARLITGAKHSPQNANPAETLIAITDFVTRIRQFDRDHAK